MATLTQSTKGKMKPLLAFSVIFLSVASMFVLDGVLIWLNKRSVISSTAANIIIAVYMLFLFLVLLIRFSISCTYIVDGVKISFNRVYIKNPRLEEQIMFREAVFFGPPEEARSRYTIRRTRRFTAKRGELITKALVYNRGRKNMMILFSPNAEINHSLIEAIKAK